MSRSPILQVPSSHNELKDCILRLMFDESDEDKPVVVSKEKSKFQSLIVMVFNQLDNKEVATYVLHKYTEKFLFLILYII